MLSETLFNVVLQLVIARTCWVVIIRIGVGIEQHVRVVKSVITLIDFISQSLSENLHAFDAVLKVSVLGGAHRRRGIVHS